MKRGEALLAAQAISDEEGVAVYLCTPKRGRWAYQTFSAVRAKDARELLRDCDQVIRIVRPSEPAVTP